MLKILERSKIMGLKKSAIKIEGDRISISIPQTLNKNVIDWINTKGNITGSLFHAIENMLETGNIQVDYNLATDIYDKAIDEGENVEFAKSRIRYFYNKGLINPGASRNVAFEEGINQSKPYEKPTGRKAGKEEESFSLHKAAPPVEVAKETEENVEVIEETVPPQEQKKAPAVEVEEPVKSIEKKEEVKEKEAPLKENTQEKAETPNQAEKPPKSGYTGPDPQNRKFKRGIHNKTDGAVI